MGPKLAARSHLSGANYAAAPDVHTCPHSCSKLKLENQLGLKLPVDPVDTAHFLESGCPTVGSVLGQRAT